MRRVPASTRRHLLAAAAVGGPAALLAACGDDGTSANARREAVLEDIRILNNALDIEFVAIAAYRATGRLLHGDALGAARRFLDHEREHVALLERAIRQLGGKPLAPHQPEEYARGFPRMRSQRDALRFVADVEQTVIRTYMDTLPRISDAALRREAAAIAAAEAEHHAVLLQARGLQPAPKAFVTGKD